MQRYALYYAPQVDSKLWRVGCEWLGRDAYSGRPVAQPSVPAVAARALRDATANPRRYGFHATLKAPFALMASNTERELLAEAKRFADENFPVSAPPLKVERLHGFFALTLVDSRPRVAKLANSCVTAFDRFRAPAAPEEMARREAMNLTSRQSALLRQWGYPYVMDEYRFHMTLTRSISDNVLAAQIEADLLQRFSPFRDHPLELHALSVFRQSAPDQPFRVLAQFPKILATHH